MELLTTRQAELWGISPRRVALLCAQGRIPGVAKADAEYDAFNKTQKIVSDFDREVRKMLEFEGHG